MGKNRKPKPRRQHFIVQLFERTEDGVQQTGIQFDSAELGGQIPRAGDCMIAPFPNDSDKHYGFEVVGRYFLRGVQQANVVRLLVQRRELTAAERGIFEVA